MAAVLTNSDSVAQLIWKSKVFTSWFEDFVKQLGTNHAAFGARVKNLCAAKQRFESYSKPLCRIILWLPAVLRTMQAIASDRDTKPEGRAAKRWLANTSAHDLLQLAMLADAADEAMILIRTVDDESKALSAWSFI